MEVVPAIADRTVFRPAAGILKYDGVECVAYTFEGCDQQWFDSRPLAEVPPVLDLSNIRRNVRNLDDDVKANFGTLVNKFGLPRTANGSPYLQSGLNSHDEKSKTPEVREFLSHRDHAWCVNEIGLCGLVLASNKPAAKAFRTWLCKEVIPSLHRTGTYTVPRQQPLARPRPLAIQAPEKSSLEVYLEEGGFVFAPHHRALHFPGFWEGYKRWCHDKPMDELKKSGRESLLIEAACKMSGPGSVTVENKDLVVGMDLAALADKPWRKYGRNTLTAFLMSGTVAASSTAKITVSMLRREYADFCKSNKCREQAWTEFVVSQALLEFERKTAGARVEPMHNRGKKVDGCLYYTGLDLTTRVRKCT